VELGLLGAAPHDADWQVAAAEYDMAAVILAATLAAPSEAGRAIAAGCVVAQGPIGALAGRRLDLGRLMTVVA
jgi:hypothetical protein